MVALRWHVCAVLFAVFSPGLAEAQYFGAQPQNPVARAWNGFYAGAHIGASQANYEAIFNPGANSYSDSSSGATYGLFGGYNTQWSTGYVAGIEADFTASLPNGSGFAGATLVGTTSDWSGSVRGRLGFTVDQFMIYGTAGFALADIDYATAAGLDDSAEFGAVIGLGVEAEISHGLFARAEYLYTSYGSGSYTLGPLTASGADFDTHTLRVGIGYEF